MHFEIPKTASAVQLTGPDELTLNRNKPVPTPGPYQILCKVEAVGLCFSDLKLLKQFADHARKAEILSGIDRQILGEMPNYVPDDKPTVPGHETVVRVAAIGDKVKGVNLGSRYLVQTDYRWLPTPNSNASFGYNFEGGLQQYVLMDQRVITSPKGESFLLPAAENLSASAIALVEPWACVEEAYAVNERTTLKTGGQMLLVADSEFDEKSFAEFLDQYGRPAKITWLSQSTAPGKLGVEVVAAQNIAELGDAAFDDVIYFGSNPKTVESLFAKIGPGGLFNIVQCNGKFNRLVTSAVGRVHYGNIRIIGTVGNDPADAMQYIPPTGQIYAGDRINVIGAGGPMGVMHVIRNICQNVEDLTICAGDLDQKRLGFLSRIAQPMAKAQGVTYVPYDPAQNTMKVPFNYVVLMAPIPKLVAGAVADAAPNAIINIFAGIPAHVTGDIDLDTYIEKHCYFIGTSGSVLRDMQTVLGKVELGSLNTDISVAAVSGLDGAVDGIRAVENHLIGGKIIVYPTCQGLPLTPLEKLEETLPDVAAQLDDGLWNIKAEHALLEHYSK